MNPLLPVRLSAFLLCWTFVVGLAAGQSPMDQTVDSASTVLDEIMAVPASQIPQTLLASARGVAIFPNVVKGGLVVGLRHGRGVVLIRDEAGNWHPPMFASLTGGSVGWQAGIQATDVILVFKTRRTVDGLMGGKLTIGVDAAAAAGPVGREAAAATDARLSGEILSYSRSRGLFAGVSIDGSSLQLDHAAGSAYYGTPVVGANGQAIRPLASVPASAIRLMNRLAHYTGAPQIVPTSASTSSMRATSADAASVSESESARRQLVSSWRKLSVVLDDTWKAFLAPPPEVLAGTRPDTEAVRGMLQRYDTVASQQRYAALSQTPEFAAMHRFVRDYLTLESARPQSPLALPPPPAHEFQ